MIGFMGVDAVDWVYGLIAASLIAFNPLSGPSRGLVFFNLRHKTQACHLDETRPHPVRVPRVFAFWVF